MENFLISDVIWKNDGTPILVMEVSYDAYRRPGGVFSYTSETSRRGQATNTGSWSDHYRDDLLLISLDREGAFSSFYPFLTPSRLRIIYNDEIKTNSTVSEYILDGSGNYKRSSVLSTEYQELRLRFLDAEQISSTELLVPSQNSFNVNLVKIDFSK